MALRVKPHSDYELQEMAAKNSASVVFIVPISV